MSYDIGYKSYLYRAGTDRQHLVFRVRTSGFIPSTIKLMVGGKAYAPTSFTTFKIGTDYDWYDNRAPEIFNKNGTISLTYGSSEYNYNVVISGSPTSYIWVSGYVGSNSQVNPNPTPELLPDNPLEENIPENTNKFDFKLIIIPLLILGGLILWKLKK
jgi:hypothetical protein